VRYKSLFSAAALILTATSLTPATAGHVALKNLPAQLGPNARAQYRDVFEQIHASRWAAALSLLDGMPEGPLHNVARAEIYLGKGSPKVDGSALNALLTKAPELPESYALARLAAARGVASLPSLPNEQDVSWLGAAPRRGHTTAAEDSARAGVAARIISYIKTDQPAAAEAFLEANASGLNTDCLTEMRQRVAWSYYITGDDTAARALAAKAHDGSGEWSAQADWIAGLAAWRQRDYAKAASMFLFTAQKARNPELSAAGSFWAARSAVNANAPHAVSQYLRAAAAKTETFYGLLAQSALGQKVQLVDDPTLARIPAVEALPNVRAALALAEIGENKLADSLIRHQAKIGDGRDHASLAMLAGKLDLPHTQLWLAQNGPSGAVASVAARYPAPEKWQPEGGWRVDRSLVYAHILEESRFQTNVTSPAGARGLMQVMPATASAIARRRGLTLGSLYNPNVNMNYGQIFIEKVRDMPETGGMLPKVIAAYNAGTAPIAVWNAKAGDGADPLLYIESIPYWETRAYVTTVMRNYWMYQQQSGETTHSMAALAQGMWPRFPGMSGAVAVRIEPVNRMASAMLRPAISPDLKNGD
jgi:soluble lytic murein transglycosylase-like protein